MKRLSILLILAASLPLWAMPTFTDMAADLPALDATVSTAAWGDVNNDGSPDLFVCSADETPGALFLNSNGIFSNATELYQIPVHALKHVRKAECLDYNGDGLLDLFVLTNNSDGLRLLTLNADDRYELVPILPDPVDDPIRSALWTDVDADGLLDLVLSNSRSAGTPMTVYLQEGAEFAEMRDNPWETDLSSVGAMSVIDFDRDGDLDVFFGTVNHEFPRMYVNNGDGYYNYADKFKIGNAQGGLGAVWFDFNNDERLDLFLTGEAKDLCLYQGAYAYDIPGLQRAAITRELAVLANGSRDAHAVDVDMDGWTDLFLVQQNGFSTVLLRNAGGTQWEDITAQTGLPDGASHVPSTPVLAGAWADYDGDGDLDAAIAEGSEGIHLYRNDTGTSHEYVHLDLRAQGGSTPLPDCNIMMVFDRAKCVTTTSPRTCASGSDWSSVTLISSDTRKSDHAYMIVNWPNGMESRYDDEDFVLNGTTTLYQPDMGVRADPELEQDADVSEMTICPNPFNPTTTISFTLPEAMQVKLAMYNVIGQEVAVLTNGELTAGSHRFTFSGTELPSGVYFSRLTAGSTTKLVRLLLTK